MHEMSIAVDILDAVERAAAGVGHVMRIEVAVGPFSGVCPDSLELGLEAAAGARGLGRPEIVVLRLDASLECRRCGRVYAGTDIAELCPACGALEKRIISGRELVLNSVDVRNGGSE
jgi:hydrogenase nickel incorporation protein HypA/HybF